MALTLRRSNLAPPAGTDEFESMVGIGGTADMDRSLEARDAHRCPQLPRQGALSARQTDGPVEVRLRGSRIRGCQKKQLALEPKRLGHRPELLIALRTQPSSVTISIAHLDT
jgi:hypothetical protein